MINIDFYDKSFSVVGHAEYAKEGEDIVCAAVSSASQITANILSSITDTSINAHKGHLSVQLHKKSIYTDFVTNALKDAMYDLQHQYPENVKVNIHIK